MADPSQVTVLDFTPTQAGMFRMTCGMNMFGPGTLIVTAASGAADPAMESSPAQGVPALELGVPAPDFGALDLADQPVELSTLRGQPVWIHFGATWCSRCTAQLPLIAEKYRQYAAQGLVPISVYVQESPEEVRAGLPGPFDWHVLADQSGKLAQLYHVTLQDLPAHMFIDRAGVLVSFHQGELSAAQMDEYLQPILAVPASPSAPDRAGLP